MKTRVSLKHIVSYCLWKLFFDSNLPQTPSNVISLKFFATLTPFKHFWLKTRTVKWQQSTKICLTW